MFDIGWSELLIIGIVALIAIGPKELPGVLRAVGQWMGKIRRMASEFQSQFHEAMREAEMADIKKQVDDITSQASSVTNFDPLADVRRDIENIGRDKPAETPAAAEPAAVALPATDTLPPAPEAAPVAPADPPSAADVAAPAQKAGSGA